MKISSAYCTQFQRHNKFDSENICSQKTLPVSFCGHLGTEAYSKDGIEYLIHETAFFRDLKTKEYIKKYVMQQFAHKDSIKILVGGCSTGEEAYTLSMMLDKIKDKVKIIGFDLSEKSINQAKSGIITMIKPVRNDKFYDYTDAYKDGYLCFNTGDKLSPQELETKTLFDSFFEPYVNTNPTVKEKIKKFLIQNVLKCETSKIKMILKPNKAKNCDFVVGDILKLDKITKGEKAEVITFSNSVYHLLCCDLAETREIRDDAIETVEQIVKSVKANLAPNGLFVIGENEFKQSKCSVILPRILENHGFVPMNENKNIWKIV